MSFNNYLQPNEEKEIFSIKEAFDNAFALVYKLLESKQIECKFSIEKDFKVLGVKKRVCSSNFSDFKQCKRCISG